MFALPELPGGPVLRSCLETQRNGPLWPFVNIGRNRWLHATLAGSNPCDRSNMASNVESADEFFSKAGPMPPVFDDGRRYPRFYFRTCAEATIYPIGGKKDAPAGPC